MKYRLTRLLSILALTLSTTSADGLDIIIVKSSDNDYFNQSIETLINNVEREAHFKVVASADLEEPVVDPGQDHYFVALGLSAAQAVARIAGDTPTINAYLTFEQYRQLRADGQMSVLLDQPLSRYLAFCRLLLGSDSIGLLTDEPVAPGSVDRKLLDELEFTFNQYRIDENNKLLPVLRRLLRQNDALLMLPRREIFNPDSLKGVLLTSYRFRKPVISYSPAHVKAGALASIYSSPSDIGRHIADVVNRSLQRPRAPLEGYEMARYYTIATNTRVARALELSLPAEPELRARLERLLP